MGHVILPIFTDINILSGEERREKRRRGSEHKTKQTCKTTEKQKKEQGTNPEFGDKE
jgi:hypothetical protein